MKNNIEIQLEKIKVKKLSEHEQHELWQTIVNQLPARKFQSVLFPLLLKPRVMLGIFIALMLTLGGTATVQAANSSAPGDILFPFDRTIENIQLKLVNSTKKEELKVKFSQERIDEINHIITEIETDGNVTIDQSVKITSTSTVSATSSDFTDERLQNALGVALHFINETKLDLEASGNSEAVMQINQLLDDLGNDLQNLSSGAKYRLKLESNDDKLRFEIRSKEKGEEKVELRLRSDEEKNRLQIKNREDEFELEFDDDSVHSTSSVSQVVRGLTEAEVKIYSTSSSMVKVEFNNQSSSFMLASSDRETIIVAIMSKYNVTRQAVEAVLKIEIISNTSTSGSASSTSSQESGGQSNDDNDDSNDDNINTNGQNGSVFMQRIEAEVRQDKTRVRVKYQGQNDQEFDLAVLSRSELVSALAIKYNLPELVIEGLLKFEVSE